MKKPEDRDRYALFLEPPIYTVRSVIAVRTDNQTSVEKIQDLFGRTVMVPDGAATVQYMRDTYPNITVDEGGDIFTCLNKLIRGRHNFIVYHDIGLFGAIKEKALQDQITILPIVLDEYPHYVAVRRSLASDMIQQLKTALIELRTNRRLETIRARYMDSGGTMEIRMSADVFSSSVS